PAQRDTGREALKRLGRRAPAIICTNNFLGQGVIDAIDPADEPPILGCFDEIPMMHLLPIPIACSNQDVPMLAEACVDQLLPQLRGTASAGTAPTILPARIITNRAFDQKRASA